MNFLSCLRIQKITQQERIYKNESYNDDPKPTYDPQKKIASNPIASVPTKVPISHNGIRPVVPVFDIIQ